MKDLFKHYHVVILRISLEYLAFLYLDKIYNDHIRVIVLSYEK